MADKIMNRITPSAYLEYCPLCEAKLDLHNVIGGTPTTCTKCEYIEPGGSAVVVTFISECMAVYANNSGVESIYIGDKSLTSKQAMSGDVYLPMLVEKAYQTRYETGLHGNELADLIGLTPLVSPSSASGHRVTMSAVDINITQTLCELTFAFDEWVSISRELKLRAYDSEIKIPEDQDISKMSAMLVVATRQQELEKVNKNEPK